MAARHGACKSPGRDEIRSGRDRAPPVRLRRGVLVVGRGQAPSFCRRSLPGSRALDDVPFRGSRGSRPHERHGRRRRHRAARIRGRRRDPPQGARRGGGLGPRRAPRAGTRRQARGRTSARPWARTARRARAGRGGGHRRGRSHHGPAEGGERSRNDARRAVAAGRARARRPVPMSGRPAPRGGAGGGATRPSWSRRCTSVHRDHANDPHPVRRGVAPDLRGRLPLHAARARRPANGDRDASVRPRASVARAAGPDARARRPWSLHAGHRCGGQPRCREA